MEQGKREALRNLLSEAIDSGQISSRFSGMTADDIVSMLVDNKSAPRFELEIADSERKNVQLLLGLLTVICTLILSCLQYMSL